MNTLQITAAVETTTSVLDAQRLDIRPLAEFEVVQVGGGELVALFG